MTFKVEIRDTCKVCGGDLPNTRHRTYCSATCRNKFFNKKYASKGVEWQRANRARIASVPDPENKVQCAVCGLWYVQLCTHTYQVHGMTGREYREHFELEVVRGVVPEWYRKLKGDQALDNETFKNLEHGAKYRFKKGQKGVGIYNRSPVTLMRLKDLWKYRKR